MGNDLQKGTTYATGGVGGQGSITSANLNAHVDDAVFKATCISARADRAPGALTDNMLLESSGTLYKMLLSTLSDLLIQLGSVTQTVAATPYTANANLTAVIPQDDTIPQIGEGTQILSLNITPRSVSSQIRLTFNGFGTVDTASTTLTAALFRTGNANALNVTQVHVATINFRVQLSLDWVDTPVSTSTQTYSIRIGPSSNIGRMNGTSSARLFGGAAACTLIAQEIKA